ncbi:MAG: hypothetical protein ACYC63_02940 [Armatimonadota bacterium]
MNDEVSGLYCSECNQMLNDKSHPCTNCGSTARDVRLFARGSAGLSGSVQLRVGEYPERLLQVASVLIQDNELSIAVVVAHMACEMAVEHAVAETLKAPEMARFEKLFPTLFNGYGLNNEKNLKLYVALTGDQIISTPFWTDYRSSAELRNKIIHIGRLASREQAEQAHDVATQLVAHVTPPT